MKNPYIELKEDILDEESAIQEALNRLEEIRKRFSPEQKDYTTEPAMGTYLMNFYNGVENIMKRICRQYYSVLPEGGSWHKELLNMSCTPPEGKMAVFSKEIVNKLHQYRNFRHRFISGYGFQLKAEKMLELVDNIGLLWNDIKKAIDAFFKKLQSKS